MTMTPPSHDPASVPSGSYKVESDHTQVLFSVEHLGITPFYGTFSRASGTLVIDAGNPSRDQLTVGVPVESLYTTSAKLTAAVKGPNWLDAAAFPTMTFRSTSVVLTSPTTAEVHGMLSLHGVTKPVTLTANFQAAGKNPLLHLLNFGFTVSGTIRRSDFGVSAYIPLVGDELKLIIAASFIQ
jgi:polyisoprenoid-binding protein YceI